MRKLLVMAALCMAAVLAFAPMATAQSTSASASASAGASCVPNGEGGEACSGLSTEEASELAAEGYSCDQTDNGAYCEGVPASSPTADPCPDPDFPRETPDGCQASDLPDVVPGAEALAVASASASADVITIAPGGPCATPEIAEDVVGVPVDELPNAYLNRNDPVGSPISSPLDPDGNGIACDDGGSAMASASASASAEPIEALPETGGTSPAAFALPSLALLVAGGLFGLRLVRR